MNRAEYLKELKSYLRNLSEEDRKDAIEYCTQYFDEAGMSNEEKAIKELGTPRQFASSLIANITIKNESKDEEVKNTKKKNAKGDIKTIWIVLIAIAAFPFGLPILISILSVLFGFLVAGICVIFVLGVVIFAVPFSIIMGFPITIPFLNELFLIQNTNSFLIGGAILLSISILIFTMLILYKVIKFLITIIKKIVIYIYNKINKNNVKLPTDIHRIDDILINKSFIVNENISEIYIEANAIEFEVEKTTSVSKIEISLKNFLKEEYMYFAINDNKLTIKSLNGVNSVFGRPKVIVSISEKIELDIFNVKSIGSHTSLNNIVSKKVVLHNDASKLTFMGSAIDIIDVYNKAGQLDANLKTNSKNISVENDSGNLTIKTTDISKYSYSLRNYAGEIQIADKKYSSLNNDVLNDKNDMVIKVDNSKGKVSVL